VNYNLKNNNVGTSLNDELKMEYASIHAKVN